MSILLFFQSFSYHAVSTMKFDSWPFAWDPHFLLSFIWAPYIIFQGLFRLHNLPIRQFCTTGGNKIYRDCIAHAICSDSWATMDTASGPGVRGTSFRAIPQFIKIIHRILQRNPTIYQSQAIMYIMLPSLESEEPCSGKSNNLST